MTIEFRCSQCDRLLATPDDSAGRQARCPGCGGTVPIPGTKVNWEAAGAAAANPFSEPAAAAPPKPAPAPAMATSTNPYATSSTYSPQSWSPPVPFGPAANLQHSIVTFDGLFSSTWTIFFNQIGPCLLFGLATLAVAFGFNLVLNVFQMIAEASGEPGVAIAVSFVIQVLSFLMQTYIQVGSAAFMVHLARQGQASAETFIAAGKYFGRWLVISFAWSLLAGLVVLVCLSPALIALGFQAAEFVLPGFIIGGFVAAVLLVTIGLTFYLTVFFIVDRNLGIIEALQASMTFMSGNRITVLLVGIITGFLCALAVLFTCGLGIIAVVPYVQLLAAVIYMHATGQPTFDVRPQRVYAT